MRATPLLVVLAAAAMCSTAAVAKGKRHQSAFTGHNATKDQIRIQPLDKPSGDIWLKAENLGEEVHVNIYKKDGTFDDAALAKLDDMFRCTKSAEVRAVRAELYEQM